jgi:signal transduction histidine kinase
MTATVISRLRAATSVTAASGAARRSLAFMLLLLVCTTLGILGQFAFRPVPDPLVLILAAAAYLMLFLRSKWPVAVLCAVVGVEALQLMLFSEAAARPSEAANLVAFQPVPINTMVAVYTVGILRRPLIAWSAGVAAGIALFGLSFALYPAAFLSAMIVMFDLVIVATVMGTWVRQQRGHRARREQMQQDRIRQEVVAERMRIARELHDILAHNLTLVNAQAGVARYLLSTDPAASATALSNITIHTRKALDDLRSTVGLLRDDRADPDDAATPSNGLTADPGPVHLAPTHTLTHLPEMITSFRTAGNTVNYTEHGQQHELPPLHSLSAFRIVQESLTNAAKHATGAPVTVELNWAQDALDVRVTNRKPSADPFEHVRPHKPTGAGHGLIGMRERAVAVGGQFSAGQLEGGGFAVHATIPYRYQH